MKQLESLINLSLKISKTISDILSQKCASATYQLSLHDYCPFPFSDIDDCSNHPCKNGAICTDRVNSYSCECAQGYTGATCETGMFIFTVTYSKPWNMKQLESLINLSLKISKTISDILSQKCASATYQLSLHDYCPFPFSDIDDCSNHPCKNGATCTDRVNSYSCECAQGYTGATCETGMFYFHCDILQTMEYETA